MSNILKVVKPFFVMEVGDTFKLQEDEYVSTFGAERTEDSDSNSIVTSRYESKYSISKEYAELLVKDGFLKEVRAENEKNDKFVNVFDEIHDMLETYTEELSNIDEDMANQPACLKIEKETVLRNLINALSHLNSLKK
jgi:hypothetical protein